MNIEIRLCAECLVVEMKRNGLHASGSLDALRSRVRSEARSDQPEGLAIPIRRSQR